MKIIISGYGMKPQNTLALYQYEKDQMIQRQWQTSIENASFVCQGDGYLYTVTESEEYAIVYAFRQMGKEYQLIDQRKLEGGSLCHITYSGKNKALFGACYGTGTVFSIQVQEGKFGEVLFQEIQQGTDSSALTRAHCVVLNQQESELIVINIALDQIYFYKIDEGSMNLSQILETPKGVGPRHALLAEDEKYLYIITEYSNEILVYENNGEKPLLQRISTLSQNYSGISYCSTLCFSKNRQFLYAANRGADTIALFTVGSKGELQLIEEYDCGGKHPRHMIVSEEGLLLVVCNQNSDNVAIFDLDVDHGFIKSKTATFEYAIPSGVLEIGVN